MDRGRDRDRESNRRFVNSLYFAFVVFAAPQAIYLDGYGYAALEHRFSDTLIAGTLC